MLFKYNGFIKWRIGSNLIFMENKEPAEKPIGEMHKRREPMADGKRYIIYYTFENKEIELPKEVNENV